MQENVLVQFYFLFAEKHTFTTLSCKGEYCLHILNSEVAFGEKKVVLVHLQEL